MKTSNKPGISHLVALCFARGLRRVVLSPGSRNAPLSISFLGHGGFDVRVVADERAAAFIALGMSQTDHKATVLVCTSGSAMLDYAPAVSEACYQQVPMLIFSADRPEEWVDQMEGQTMRQEGALSNFVNQSFQLPQEALSGDDLWFSDRMVNTAITATTYPKPGVVHVNVPLREPLYDTVSQIGIEELKTISIQHAPSPSLSEEQLDALAERLENYSQVMLLMGQYSPNRMSANVLSQLAERGVVVLTETSSNAAGLGVYPCIDRSIAGIPKNNQIPYLPELIISCGGPMVSKRIKTMLRNHHAQEHWHIDPVNAEIDLFQSLTEAIFAEPTSVLEGLAQRMNKREKGFASRWAQLEEEIKAKHQSYLADAPFSDLKVYEALMASLPEGVAVQMANSAAVRYAQLFEGRADIHYYSNRGVSGIEGCTSTAMGMAWERKSTTVLLTGDMAFRYDINAFWLRNIPAGLKCIVVNNEGGGIFRIIPGPDETDHLEQAFEAHQDNGAKAIADMYKLPYYAANNETELKLALAQLFADDSTAILEVFTPREENAGILRRYFKHLANV